MIGGKNFRLGKKAGFEGCPVQDRSNEKPTGSLGTVDPYVSA